MDNLEDNIDGIVKILTEKGILSTDALIMGFAKSSSYKEAGFNSELLKEVPIFTQNQISCIVKATIENR